MICYCCGKEARFQLKNKKWCCSKSYNSCSESRKIRSKSLKGKQPWNKGLSKETSQIIKASNEKLKGIVRNRLPPLKSFNNIDNKLCSYGCEQNAKYILKNGKVCCSKFLSQCNGIRNKNSIGNRGKILSVETRLKISKKLMGHIVSESVKKIISLSRKGKDNRSKESIEKQRQYMLNGGAVKCIKAIKKISNEELKLSEMVKQIYPKAEQQYRIFNYALDIALVDHKIAIEYDGYYHFYNEEIKKYHKFRQERIEKEGWKFIRYTMYDKFPSLDKIKNDINLLLYM